MSGHNNEHSKRKQHEEHADTATTTHTNDKKKPREAVDTLHNADIGVIRQVSGETKVNNNKSGDELLADEEKAKESLHEVAISASKIPLCGKVALITGITGQDGSYLAEFLLGKGYVVHGIIRRSSSFNTGRIEHLYMDQHSGQPRLMLHYGDMTDSTNLVHILRMTSPDEVYNLAAQSHVKVSFEMSEYTANVDGLGTLRLLDAIRTAGLGTKTRFYQASTSELYGKVQETPQKETTPFYPRSPYAVAKQFAYWIVVNYREAYNMFAVNGILFNHESPRRGPTFVTRKVTMAVSRIHNKLQDCLFLGNIDAQRDWGHAKDYVEAMWMMLQANEPEDFVVATNETHRVREFVEKSFAVVGTKIKWVGEGVEETGVDTKDGRVLVRIDSKYFRPTEVDLLLGDSTKIRTKLGWKPKVTFDQLVKEMMAADLKACNSDYLKW